MKKNKFLKLASGLLVLCLLTTCVISTTFAKYTTSGSANDTARVAKWGVEITQLVESDEKAFATEYDNGTDVTVQSSTTDKLVAPGTDGTLVQFKITGTPEVAYGLDFNFTSTDVVLAAGTYKDWTTADATDTFTATEYHPVKFTVNKNGTDVKTDISLAALETYILGLDATYDANDPIDDTYIITWEWTYNVDAAADKADTLLGNIAADKATYGAGMTEGTDYNLTIDFALTITATQID